MEGVLETLGVVQKAKMATCLVPLCYCQCATRNKPRARADRGWMGWMGGGRARR